MKLLFLKTLCGQHKKNLETPCKMCIHFNYRLLELKPEFKYLCWYRKITLYDKNSFKIGFL